MVGCAPALEMQKEKTYLQAADWPSQKGESLPHGSSLPPPPPPLVTASPMKQGFSLHPSVFTFSLLRIPDQFGEVFPDCGIGKGSAVFLRRLST